MSPVGSPGTILLYQHPRVIAIRMQNVFNFPNCVFPRPKLESHKILHPFLAEVPYSSPLAKTQQKQRQISIRIAPKIWNQRPQRIQEIPFKMKMSLRRVMVMIHQRLKHPPTKGLVAIQEAKKQGRLLLKGAYP